MKMKDKREAEQQQKAEHLARIRADKARRQQPRPLARAAPVREENPTLLIVCQGTVTEVEYFRHFELATADIRVLGQAFDPEKLVAYALELREEARQRKDPYQQVWCVFDKDDTEPGNFHAALQRADAQGLQVAYSNQAFEYWLLLHFDPHPGGGMGRQACGQRLEGLIAAANPAVRYDAEKGKHISRALFDLLEADDPGAAGRLPRRKVAIGRAKAIAERWTAQGIAPAYRESTTEVYRLVLVLQQHLPSR
jgi:hypothetical protein